MNPQASKTYLNLSWHIPEEQFDLASAALADYPFLGISEENDRLIVCFDAAAVGPALREEIETAFGHFGIDSRFDKAETLAERNWNAEWESSIEPVRISDRIVFTPEWKKEQVDAEIRVVVTPKMSFGTGHHQTTRMMAQALEDLVRPGSVWIDAGTGTGALAIVAVRLGADRVLAFDNDDWSVANARENIGLNEVSRQVDLQQADVNTLVLPEADGIAANLHKMLLLPNFERFAAALAARNGVLLVSGILRFDEKEVSQAARAAGLRHRETSRDGDWIAILFQAG